MNFYQKAKVEVNLNGKFLGYASSVGIDKSSNEHNLTAVNLTIDSGIINPKTNKGIDQKENYDDFFKKFAKAFSEN